MLAKQIHGIKQQCIYMNKSHVLIVWCASSFPVLFFSPLLFCGYLPLAYLKEVSCRLGPHLVMHVHLPAAFPHDAHDTGVRDGASDAQGTVVQLCWDMDVLIGEVQRKETFQSKCHES